jgi:Xaa-Pro aminopeptidase
MKPESSLKKCTWVLLFILVQMLPLSGFAFAQPNIYGQRRDLLRGRIAGRAVILSGTSNEVVDKNFFYLTGVRETAALLLILPGAGGGDFLFVSPISEERRRTLSLTSGIVRIFSLEEFEDIFEYLLSWQWSFYFPLPLDRYDYSYYFLRRLIQRFPFLEVRDISPLLAEMRMFKSEEELVILKRAIAITAAGIWKASLLARPGMYEYELQKIIEDVFRESGAERTSFRSIIGSGPNSVIIHYDINSRQMEPGDVVVIDVGAEFSEYAGDLTRTLPVSGRFTLRQREIYDIVLEAQRRAIAACRPGATLAEVDRAARNFIEEKGYRKYFTHSIGHSLGLSVHDPWLSRAVLSPGMVITVEPGIYIPEENLGVRIEDDVLITESGNIVLSSSLPKKPEEIERGLTVGTHYLIRN